MRLAARYYQIAYDLQSRGKPTHQSVAATRYHQALICLRLPGDTSRNEDQALEYLFHALHICQFNEARRGDLGESSRIKWQVAKIWRRQGLLKEADAYKASAEKIKLELERTGAHPTAPTPEQAWDCFCDLLDR